MKRIGMKVVGRGIVREHCDLYTMDGEKIGWASSGTFAPYIGCGVAMGYIPAQDIEIGRHLNADVRGRIVGQTKDVDGEVGYVLTLSAREQHIRREKASSNICSNQALCAFAAGVYMAAMGEKGMKQCARLCTSKAHYFASELEKIGCTLKYKGEFFHEFVTEVECPNCRRKILDALEAEGILGGAEVEGGILWCVTELVSKSQLDKAVAIVKEVL